MDIAKAVNELYFFASEPRTFIFDELLTLIDANIDSKTLRKALLSKSRFICLLADSPEEDRFLLDSTLFQWFVRLNLKLAKIKKFRLTEHQLASTLNHLRRDGRWDSVPIEVVRWGQSLGLICKAYTKGHFIFPLARILSIIKSENLAIVTRLLLDFCENKIWMISIKKLLKESIKDGFSKFLDQISYIVQNREGLRTGKKVTLQELGEYYNLTRERIRQLEEKFWNLVYSRERYREPFLTAFLYDFIDNSGSLIIDINSRKVALRGFLSKCAGIPQVEFSEIGLIALATSSRDVGSLKSSNLIQNNINPEFIANFLESSSKISFPSKDIRKLAKKIALLRQSKLTKAQMVYLALRAIGKPAHYTTVVRIYNSLWPEHAMSEHNVHAVLSRQIYGIVWIGIKGTYALKEWGYERPSMTIFETVTKIVRKKYEEIGAPVPETVIIAEMGKYRRQINATSMVLAIHCNPELKKISKYTFIPRGPADQVQDEISLNELDEILKEFEEQV
ncbi:MAG: hypothetical protein KAW19_05770 [Candidatus Aminicenantes bacterium]|nr:hypothetical protein [Candidatus Aminicenantes bacterium]